MCLNEQTNAMNRSDSPTDRRTYVRTPLVRTANTLRHGTNLCVCAGKLPNNHLLVPRDWPAGAANGARAAAFSDPYCFAPEGWTKNEK